MKKIIILPLLLSISIFASPVFAQTAEEAQAPAVNSETVTNADLGISNPGLLPTNPFYFLKEFGRNVRRVFTFDSVKKAELELNITNEKAAELNKVEEDQPQNVKAIESAIQNYQENQQRLINKFQNLKETSSNPNVEKLLQNFADRAVKHAKVFDELQNKFENQSQITGEISQVRETASNVVAAASAKDEPAKFAAKVEQVLATEKGSELKNVRSVEILDNFIKNASSEVKVSLEKVKEDVSARLQTDMKNAIQTQGAETVKQAIMNLPGDAVRRTVILKELERKSGETVSGVLNSAVTAMNKEILAGENIMEKSRAQLQSAGDILSKLAARLNESVLPAQAGQAPANVKELNEKAASAYAKAKAAFEEKKYGEAFGQANSAEMAARNALRLLEEKIVPQADSLKIELDRLEMTLIKYADLLGSRNVTAESNPKAYEFITRVKGLLSSARDAYAKNDFESVKQYIGKIKENLNSIVQFIEGAVRVENKVPELKTVISTLPKFISKNKTFSNAYWRCYDGKELKEENSGCKTSEEWQAEAKKFCDGHCYADNSKCGVNSWGISNQCGIENSSDGAITTPPLDDATGIVCTQEYNPVCGEVPVVCVRAPCGSMEKTFSNACMAKSARVRVKYVGECGNEPTGSTSSGGGSVAVPVPTVSSSGGGGGGSVSTGIANPASTYCVKQGYKNIIRTSSDGSQYGVCVFPNGKECDEWKFYRGECVNTESGCGSKPVLPATPVNCKYDGPYCADGNWKYKLVCPENSSAVPTTSNASSASNPVPAAASAVPKLINPSPVNTINSY